MSSRKTSLVIFGAVLLLLGIVFALQGANMIGGSAIMSGNPTYINVGGVVSVVGLAVLFLGFRSKEPASKPMSGAS